MVVAANSNAGKSFFGGLDVGFLLRGLDLRYLDVYASSPDDIPLAPYMVSSDDPILHSLMVDHPRLSFLEGKIFVRNSLAGVAESSSHLITGLDFQRQINGISTPGSSPHRKLTQWREVRNYCLVNELTSIESAVEGWVSTPVNGTYKSNAERFAEEYRILFSKRTGLFHTMATLF